MATPGGHGVSAFRIPPFAAVPEVRQRDSIASFCMEWSAWLRPLVCVVYIIQPLWVYTTAVKPVVLNIGFTLDKATP